VRSLRGVRFAMLAAGSGAFAWLLWRLGFNVIRQNVMATGWWFLAVLLPAPRPIPNRGPVQPGRGISG